MIYLTIIITVLSFAGFALCLYVLDKRLIKPVKVLVPIAMFLAIFCFCLVSLNGPVVLDPTEEKAASAARVAHAIQEMNKSILEGLSGQEREDMKQLLEIEEAP